MHMRKSEWRVTTRATDRSQLCKTRHGSFICDFRVLCRTRSYKRYSSRLIFSRINGPNVFVASRQVLKNRYLRFSLVEFTDSNGIMLSLLRQFFSSNFLWCADHIYLIFPQGKVLVFQHVPAWVCCEMLLSLERHGKCCEKIIFSICSAEFADLSGKMPSLQSQDFSSKFPWCADHILWTLCTEHKFSASDNAFLAFWLVH